MWKSVEHIKWIQYEWTNEINISQSEDFFPNTRLSVFSFLCNSSSIVSNPFMMQHLLKFCYECRRDNKVSPTSLLLYPMARFQTIKFFDRPMLRGVKYDAEHRLMLQNLCLEAVRDVAFERALRVIDIQADADELFNFVTRRIHQWVDWVLPLFLYSYISYANIVFQTP